MNNRDDEIERLSSELTEAYHHGEPERAARLAEELARLLGDPPAGQYHWHIHSWISVWEGRGNLHEAIRLADLVINRKRTEIEAGDYDRYPELLPGEVEFLHDCLYLQACRWQKVRDRERAIECLQEIYDLAERYGVQPDQDVQSLYPRLMARTSGPKGG